MEHYLVFAGDINKDNRELRTLRGFYTTKDEAKNSIAAYLKDGNWTQLWAFNPEDMTYQLIEKDSELETE